MTIFIAIKLLVTTAKIVKTIPYSIHIEKNNQEQYFDYSENTRSHSINRKQIELMESTYFLLLQNKIQFYKEIFLHLSFVLTNKKYTLTFASKDV